MRRSSVSSRWWVLVFVLATLLVLTNSSFAFHWDWTNNKLRFSALTNLDEDSYKVADANGSGNAVVVWNNFKAGVPASVLYQFYTNGLGWSATRTAFSDTNPIAPTFGSEGNDVSMNAKGDFIIAGKFTVGSGGGAFAYKLLADLVIGGVTVSDDFLVSPNVSTFRTAISGNADAMVIYAGTSGLLARIYSGGSWQPEFAVIGSSVSSFGVAADEFGNFTVVWNPDATSGFSEQQKIYARRYFGGSWLSPELVGQSGGAATEREPRVGMYGNGRAIVAWWHSYTNYNGYVASRFDGSSWLAQESIDAGQSAGTASSRPPHLAVQPDGVAMAFFQQGNSGQQNGHLYANRLPGAGLAWEGPVDLGCTVNGLGDGLAVDMDGNGNAVVAYQYTTNYLFRAYQATLGWQVCDDQVFNGYPGVLPLSSPLPGEKSIVLTPHEIIGIWQEQHFVNVNGVNASDGLGLSGSSARKDVLINGFAMQTASPIVNLQVTLPYNDICGTNNPPAYQEMRFSNDNNLWSAWQPAPPYPPGTTNIAGWDLTAAAYGGNSASGLKRVYIQFRNSNCTDPVTTDDEILYTGGSAGSGLDIGLRLFDGTKTNKIAAEWPAVSALRIFKNGTNYGILLAATNSPDASKFRIQTSTGTKALQKLP